MSIRFSLKAWSTRIERSFVSGFLNRDLRLHLNARSKNKTQERKDVRDVWAASPADAPRICRESRRTAFWKIKKPARRAYRKIFLCGDFAAESERRFGTSTSFRQAGESRKESALTFALCVVCSFLFAEFLFFVILANMSVKHWEPDHQSAQLTWRIEPDSAVGPVLSVRAFEFERQYGVDTLVPSTTHSNKTVLVYRLPRFNAVMQV